MAAIIIASRQDINDLSESDHREVDLNNIEMTLSAHGHYKEKRFDCPLVPLGLVLDASGFPRRSHVYKGNVNEPETFSEMIKDLAKGGVSVKQKPTIVIDAGIATEDNISWLREHQ